MHFPACSPSVTVFCRGRDVLRHQSTRAALACTSALQLVGLWCECEWVERLPSLCLTTSTSNTHCGDDQPCGLLGTPPLVIGAIAKYVTVAVQGRCKDSEYRTSSLQPASSPEEGMFTPTRRFFHSATQAAATTALIQPTRNVDPSLGVPHTRHPCGEAVGSCCPRTSSEITVAVILFEYSRCRPRGEATRLLFRAAPAVFCSATPVSASLLEHPLLSAVGE